MSKSMRFIFVMGVFAVLGLMMLSLFSFHQSPSLQKTLAMNKNIEFIYDVEQVMVARIRKPQGFLFRVTFTSDKDEKLENTMQKIGEYIWRNHQPEDKVKTVEVICKVKNTGGLFSEPEKITKKIKDPMGEVKVFRKRVNKSKREKRKRNNKKNKK